MMPLEPCAITPCTPAAVRGGGAPHDACMAAGKPHASRGRCTAHGDTAPTSAIWRKASLPSTATCRPWRWASATARNATHAAARGSWLDTCVHGPPQPQAGCCTGQPLGTACTWSAASELARWQTVAVAMTATECNRRLLLHGGLSLHMRVANGWHAPCELRHAGSSSNGAVLASIIARPA